MASQAIPDPDPDPTPTSTSTDAGALDAAGSDASGAGTGNVGDPVLGCLSHWIKISLMRQPDLDPRPSWWPTAQDGAYASEQFSAEITDGPKSGSLDGQGALQAKNIPAGDCQFQGTAHFYEEIEQYFDAQLSPPSDE